MQGCKLCYDFEDIFWTLECPAAWDLQGSVWSVTHVLRSQAFKHCKHFRRVDNADFSHRLWNLASIQHAFSERKIRATEIQQDISVWACIIFRWCQS